MNSIEDFIREFKNKGLLEEALTHSSYANEHSTSNNERLEYLGDAVLELCMSDYLFNNFNINEGEMTKKRAQSVCEDALVKYAEKIGLPNYIRLGHGEEQNGGRERHAIIADAFEAFLGAVYLDQGFDRARDFFYMAVIPNITDVESIVDYKSTLQEHVQADKRSLAYYIEKEEGPAHNRTFEAVCDMEGIILGRGIGKTKKEAEQNAAKEALNKLVRR